MTGVLVEERELPTMTKNTNNGGVETNHCHYLNEPTLKLSKSLIREFQRTFINLGATQMV
jgi:hypothetical protein